MLGSLVPQRVHIHYYYGIRSRKTIPVMALGPNSIMVVYMMQGCHTPSPPHPMVCPLACQVGSCLVWPCCFPRLVLFGLVPSPPVEWGLWSFWLAPPRLCGAVCSTEVWYGCRRLLVVMSSLRALSPPPAVVVLVGPAPPVWGSVFLQRYGMVAAAC